MKILLGYDGTASSEKALDLAIKHAHTFGATVEVILSMESTEETHDTEAVPGTEGPRRLLEHAESMCNQHKVTCNTHLLIRGLSAGEDLVKFAEENDIEEIIIGIEKKSRLEKLVMGSTAQYVLLKAPCPVVAVKA